MLYEFKNGKIRTKSIEYSVSYHCNLKCSGCSHLSPFASRKFPSLDSFSKDINRLSQVMHADVIRLLGGEPLLNPDINRFIKIAKLSGIADHIMVTTNGCLLHKMDHPFWENIDYLLVTWYPSSWIKENIISLKKRAKEFNTRLWFSMQSDFRTTIVTKPHPNDWVTGIIHKTCEDAHLYHCHMLHEGKLYKCAVPPFLPEYLSKIGGYSYEPALDAFDLHSSKNLYQNLIEFFTSTKAMQACCFCLGYLGKRQKHHQLSAGLVENPRLLNINRTKHLDRFKFVKECVQYYRRRIIEKLSDKHLW